MTVGHPGGPVEECALVEEGMLELVEDEAAVLLGLGAIIENE